MHVGCLWIQFAFKQNQVWKAFCLCSIFVQRAVQCVITNVELNYLNSFSFSGTMSSLCLGVHSPKAYGSQFVCHSVILHVCNSFLKGRYNIGAGKYRMGTAWQYLKLNSLRLWIKALFSRYRVICLPQTLLWHVTDFSDDQSAWNGSPCILILESILQLQLLTAKVRNNILS